VGIKGPIPQRTDQTVRRNKHDLDLSKITAIGTVEIPDLDLDNAHPIVEDLYRSMQTSAQSKYFEDSDWQVARFTMMVLNDYLRETDANGNRKPISAMKLSAIGQLMTSLLLTEGDRRRVRIEVERTQAAGEVIDIADVYRKRLEEQTRAART
jgi:hypothetical protein